MDELLLNGWTIIEWMNYHVHGWIVIIVNGWTNKAVSEIVNGALMDE